MAGQIDNGTKGRGGKLYWRSLEELADTPKFRSFLEREFPAKASEWLGASRRTFLKVMGASLALAGLASCRRWPEDNLVPYARRPDNRMDGMPVHYASALELGGMGIGVLVTSVDGRPIKIEGNPEHPLSRGATDAYTQASVLDVYDPDRSRAVRYSGPVKERVAINWESFVALNKEAFTTNAARTAILCEATRSPSVQRLRAALPGVKWYEYEPYSNDNARKGALLAFGRPLRPVLHLDKAQVILAIDIDVFAGDPESTRWSRDFAAGRRLHDDKHLAHASMNRLYVLESNYTLSGSNADHRRALTPALIGAWVHALAGILGVGGGGLEPAGLDKAFLEKLAADLKAAGNKALVVAGPRQPAEVHALVAAINSQLGALGNTITYQADDGDPRPQDQNWQTHYEQIAALTKALNAGAIDTLLILGGNPVFNAPADLKFADALKKAKTSIHLSHYDDETSQHCTWHLPRAHYLEAWGDVRTFDGTVSITQPLIEPLFGGKSIIEVLALLSGQKKTAGMDLVRETLGGDEWKWKQSLFHGVVEGTATLPQNVRLGEWKRAVSDLRRQGEIDVVLYAGNIYDGRFANNGWLQEMPEPMTRLTWDNAALMHPRTAAKIGVASDEVVEFTGANGAKVKLSTLIMPGVAEGVIALALGYGRAMGAVAKGTGGNVYSLTSSSGGLVAGASVRKTGERYLLATVQDHNVIDPVGKNRMQRIIPELVLEGTLEEARKNPALGAAKIVSLSMWNEHAYNDVYKWGMAIDLTACTGCSACVVACHAENNVPIVGKEQVLSGREMHWIRIDRYFKGNLDELAEKGQAPQAVHQPILCMHCETAPCEEVCPVAATTHSHEGLNMMTYNRCIGTRYCSNNCPYKVRRFNFFDYNNGTLKDLYVPNIAREEINELRRMQKNPQVTVRSRGVMEKCTYCVQRIENARITAFNEGKRKIADGEVTPACAQACPTQAIVFGDLNDKDSRVSKLHAVARTYGLLDPELNTKPRTRYIAKLRNPSGGLDAGLYAKEHHGAAQGAPHPHGAGAAHDEHGPAPKGP